MVRAIRAYAVAYPFLLVAAFFVTWVAARLSIGHWPRYYFDDPTRIGGWFRVPYAITCAILIVGLPAFLIALGALIFQAFRVASLRRHLLVTAAVSILFMIAATSFLWWDPLRILEWFVD